ncbi:MAG TPA: sulfite exporter TauE/SafE family protein [Candidatus Binatia bacterium]|nr:sulfite exporter TauE/SafE family protein [Candidatus Binatia bacterium]
MTSLPLFLVTGAVAGLLAGLFGVGGGLIMVPALAALLPRVGVAESVIMQMAIGTSLAVISATSISSMLAHHRRGGVLWPVFLRFAPGLALGALAGAWAAHLLPGIALRRIVGGGALIVALQMALDARPAASDDGDAGGPATLALLAAGSVIGALSSLVGIGGGSLTVPYLTWCRIGMRQAVGTAAACGVPIAWAGAIGFIVAGWDVPGRPAGSLGYVSTSGFLGLAGASVLCAPLGARLAHRLPPKLLKRAFALLIAGIGVGMLVR